jgi:hypothetical protein
MGERDKWEARSREFYKRYYNQLVGSTIIEFVGMNLSDEDKRLGMGPEFPCFKVRLKDGTYGLIEVSRDEEGNGGGFIFGLPLPNMDDYDKRHSIPSAAEMFGVGK